MIIKVEKNTHQISPKSFCERRLGSSEMPRTAYVCSPEMSLGKRTGTEAKPSIVTRTEVQFDDIWTG